MTDMEHYLAKFSGAALVALAAVLGRAMFVAREAQAGRRKFWSPALILDLIIALAMGLIAWGVCAQYGLDGPGMAAAVAVAGYLGPHVIDNLYQKKFGKGDSE